MSFGIQITQVPYLERLERQDKPTSNNSGASRARHAASDAECVGGPGHESPKAKPQKYLSFRGIRFPGYEGDKLVFDMVERYIKLGKVNDARVILSKTPKERVWHDIGPGFCEPCPIRQILAQDLVAACEVQSLSELADQIRQDFEVK